MYNLSRVNSYAAVGSDHYPVVFDAQIHSDKVSRPRRLTKTLLQSRALAETANLYYKAALREVNTKLDGAIAGSTAEVEDAINTMQKELKSPWESQASKRRRHSPPHWNDRFLKLLARKKLLYDRMKWRPNRQNRRNYKEVCSVTQRYERQLRRERQRRNTQRIQNNPLAEIAVAIRRQVDTRKRQAALYKLSGKQLAPREYALYMKRNLDASDEGDIELETFEVDTVATTRLIERAIHQMERNKAAGEDRIHV